MTLTRRLIVCLDVDNGRVVKGKQFVELRDMGDPVELAVRYAEQGADEIVFLDITASSDNRDTMLDVVQRTAEQLFIPLTVGGGVRTVEDIASVLRAGADKVAVNTAAVERPELLTEAAERFGQQCVVASIDAKRLTPFLPAQQTQCVPCAGQNGDSSWSVMTKGGRDETGLDAVEWAQACAQRGAGEILLTSIDRDGSRDGYDLELLSAVTARVSVPVVASGGAGSADDVVAAVQHGVADAALVAGILHDGSTTVGQIKAAMERGKVEVRSVA